MTTEGGIPGSYYLRPGVRLLATAEGGRVIREDPLCLMKVNRPAFEMLRQCHQGFPVDLDPKIGDRPDILAFLERLHRQGFLEWLPSSRSWFPFVSIVIPVYNRPVEIFECLESLSALRYPRSKLEVIVVDDASQDQTVKVVQSFEVRLIIQSQNQGPAAARNAGSALARGEIIAFIDSDCRADPDWLEKLVPYFQDPRLALVGGRVEGFYRESLVDRYEEVCSALDMGSASILGRGEHSPFYVPTCNMLVRKEVFRRHGGLNETLRVGEDVDLCWKLMAAGHQLIYVPKGIVRHKHRNRFFQGFGRRFAYGTSEAFLYKRYPKISKRFPWQNWGVGLLGVLLAALWSQSLYWLLPAAFLLFGETVYRGMLLRRRENSSLGWGQIMKAVVRGHFRLIFFLTHHLVRYYLVLMLVLIWAVKDQAYLWSALILFPPLVEYRRKKPRLGLPVFVFFFLAEQIFYQSGVFWGSIKQKNFRLYRISSIKAGGTSF